MYFILLVLFLFLLFIFFIPIEIKIIYKNDTDSDNLLIEINIFYKIHGLRIKIPYIQTKLIPFLLEIHGEISTLVSRIFPVRGKKELEKELKIESIEIKYIKKMINIIMDTRIRSILKSTLKIKCNFLQTNLKFGFNNPAYTGINYGVLTAIINFILTQISKGIWIIEDSEINILPDFNNKVFKLNFEGIFTLYLGNIILTGIKIIIYNFKGGLDLWEKIQLKN